VEFAWDEGKNRINKRKHGVSFDTAVLAFDDPYHLTRQDREVDGEALADDWSRERRSLAAGRSYSRRARRTNPHYFGTKSNS
jgi:uncharacterized DUF497 family protein